MIISGNNIKNDRSYAVKLLMADPKLLLMLAMKANIKVKPICTATMPSTLRTNIT